MGCLSGVAVIAQCAVAVQGRQAVGPHLLLLLAVAAAAVAQPTGKEGNKGEIKGK